MDLREQFVLRAKAPGANVSALCREFEISRKTGHKWLRRFEQGGITALLDESRRPQSQVSCSGEAVLRVLAAREKHKRWGPKKLHRVVERELGEQTPSVRTIHRILQRADYPLVRPRKAHVAAAQAPVQAPKVDCSEPNALWTVDFKGWWRARNGQRCEPLTVRDAFSRYVLALKAHADDSHRSGASPVRAAFPAFWAPSGHPSRQRHAFHQRHLAGGPDQAVGLVGLRSAFASYAAARPSSRQWGARAHAPGHEPGLGSAPRLIACHPAAGLRRLAHRVQRAAPSRSPRHAHSPRALSTLTQTLRRTPHRTIPRALRSALGRPRRSCLSVQKGPLPEPRALSSRGLASRCSIKSATGSGSTTSTSGN